MKNLKKVLAMVLAFACTFSMFAGAKVFEDVPAGSDYSEAVTMLSDLGIIQGKDDGKYHPEDTITRAEACAMIARLMTGDPNVSQYVGAQSFTDVAKGSWKDSAIGYCYINGIVIGVGGNKFEPDRAITDAEFITMVVRAMGYETADMKQNYPYSYMSNAQAIGLLDGTNMVASTDALRGEDAQVIYNALFTDYARGAKLVNTTHGTSVEQYPTLAESVWGLERAAVGTYTGKDDETATLTNCKAHTWVVIGTDPSAEGYVLAYPIDDDTTDIYETDKNDVDGNAKTGYHTYSFKYAGDVDSIKGYQVELWGQGSHGEPTWEKSGEKVVYSEDWEIKAIKTVKGQAAYDYNASMADKKDDNGTIELGETSLDLETVASNASKVTYKAQNPTTATFLGGELNATTIKDDKSVETALNVRNGDQYKLMDWDNDGDVDWVVVDEARYYKVETATSKRVTVSTMDSNKDLESAEESKTETWKLDELEKIDTNVADKDVKIKYVAPDSLAEGDIVEVTYKVAYDKSEKAQVVTATISVVDAETKSLDEVGTKDGLTLVFDDEEMKVAQNANLGDVIVPANPAKYADFNGEELGTEFALYTDRNGFIVYSDYANETSNYMMVLNTYGGKNTTGNRDLAVIDFIASDDTEHKDVKVASDARVLKANGDSLGAYSNRTFDESKVVGNVFKYWTDEDGVITKMQEVFTADAEGAYDTSDNYSYKSGSTDRLLNSADKYVSSLEDANVIFAVKGDYISEDDNGGVSGSNDLKVNAGDVKAVKQSDIPSIEKKTNAGGDTDAATLLGASLNSETSWLSAKNSTATYVLENDKNSAAKAAILGVENFNKFDAGSTKIGLVTNIAERSGGTIKATVAYNGEVTTLSSAEKSDFDDIVKVYDGSKDVSVTGVDSTITVANNGIFNNKKLSEVVNEGGMYAEITTDADGKLTKVTFLDDNADNDNLLNGHYYDVSRNLVLNVTDKKVRYGLNDAKDADYGETAQYYAGANDKLYTVGRLEAESASYADGVGFYTIDATPTRHDKDYDATRLTVTAGFYNLDDADIKVGEYTDIDYAEPDYQSTKNVYEIADIAFKGDDIVAMYSFKSMDEKNGSVSTIDYNVNDVQADATQALDDVQVGTWTRIANGPVVTGAKIVPVSGSVDGVVTDAKVTGNKITVDVAKNAQPCEFKLELMDADGKTIVTTGTIKVTAANVTSVVLTAGDDLTFGESNSVEITSDLKENLASDAEIKIYNEAGEDKTSDFQAVTDDLDQDAKKITVQQKATTPAGKYTVKVAKDGYTFNDVTFNIAKADMNVTVTAPTAGAATEVTVKFDGTGAYDKDSFKLIREVSGKQVNIEVKSVSLESDGSYKLTIDSTTFASNDKVVVEVTSLDSNYADSVGTADVA